MGNAQGHHGDHFRKHSGHHGGTEGLTFGDRIHGRETSPFDPVRFFHHQRACFLIEIVMIILIIDE